MVTGKKVQDDLRLQQGNMVKTDHEHKGYLTSLDQTRERVDKTLTPKFNINRTR